MVVRAVGPFALGDGTILPTLDVAYRHDGPGPAEAPQVLVIHALTGSADAAGDWWAPLIGPGRALDTTRVGVLCANLLGGCYGTTGPTTTDASTGRPWGADFPAISTRDQARAQWALLDALGIERLALVAGGSLGGMVALEVALERPEAVGEVLPIAAPAATGALAIAWNGIQLELVRRLGEDGLDLARRLAMTTYRSEADFEHRFGRAAEPDGTPSITSYLAYQGRKLVARFDPDAYRVLVQAMDRHDAGAGRGGLRPCAGSPRRPRRPRDRRGHSGRRPVRARPGARARGCGRRRGCPCPVPRAALDEGPRRLPGRVGPVGGDRRRRAGGGAGAAAGPPAPPLRRSAARGGRRRLCEAALVPGPSPAAGHPPPGARRRLGHDSVTAGCGPM